MSDGSTRESSGQAAPRAASRTHRHRRPRLVLREHRREGVGAPPRDEPLAARARRALRHHPVGDRPSRARRPASADRHLAADRRGDRVRPHRRSRAALLVAWRVFPPDPPMIVACLGDSITAGSPLWDPDAAARALIATPDERSQWEWWAMRADPGL